MRSFVRLTIALGCFGLLALTTAIPPAFATSPNYPSSLAYPTTMPPISVTVVKDSLDSQGHWVQTVRLTIRPGGTLGDASTVVYGDVTHVTELFAAAQRANPHLISPALVPVGQNIDLTIDPTKTFVLDAVLHTQDTMTQRFTNGVVNTVYLKPRGTLTRVVSFPSQKPTDYFTYPSEHGPVQVRSGGKIVDLAYVANTSFADVVKQVYGVATYAAAADFTHQTGWDPTHWAPPVGTTKRVIAGPPSLYESAPHEVNFIPNPNPAGRARQQALHQERLRVGVYAIRRESFGTVYHVAVNDASMTARDLSTLIYGTPDHSLAIARAAGFQVPAGAQGAAQFDPHVFGRAFDLAVDYADEQVVAWRSIDAQGVETVGLVDGAEIVTYPPAASGPIDIIRYPTGSKRIVYRPSKISLMLAQGLGLFHVASDLNLPGPAANAAASDYAAQLLWRWSPRMPRDSGDIADSIKLVDAQPSPLMVILVGPPVPHTVVDQVANRLGLGDPLVAAVELVIAGSLVVIVIGIFQSRARRMPRVRW